MALGNQVFKVIGMWRDNSESSQDNKYAYENFNMRIEARDGNTQLSMENERGNQKIDIIGKKINDSYTDAQASISDGFLEIQGTPIGYCQIGDDILLFTTETERMSDAELREYNEDLNYTTNKKNTFTLSSVKIDSMSYGENTSNIKMFLSLREISDWACFLDDLDIKLKISTISYTNSKKDQCSFVNYTLNGLKTAEPINNGLLYDFNISSVISANFLFIHSLEISYNDNLAAIIDLRTLLNISDYKSELLSSVVSFPSYIGAQSDFTTGFTTVGDYATQLYKEFTINGTSSQTGNIISFTPNNGYTNVINAAFSQKFTDDELDGLQTGGELAEVDDTTITVESESLHSDIVVLKSSDDSEPIDAVSLSCSPSSVKVGQLGTFNVTVTPTPSNADCTAICTYAEEYIQLVSRNNNTFTFRLLSMGEAEAQYINFSCEENHSLSATCEVRLGVTSLVDTPLTHEVDPYGGDEFKIKIYSSQYHASDFIIRVDGGELTHSNNVIAINSFLYTINGIQDVVEDDYNIELDIFGTPIDPYSDTERTSVLTIYYPDFSYFASITFHQSGYDPTAPTLRYDLYAVWDGNNKVDYELSITNLISSEITLTGLSVELRKTLSQSDPAPSDLVNADIIGTLHLSGYETSELLTGSITNFTREEGYTYWAHAYDDDHHNLSTADYIQIDEPAGNEEPPL